MPEAIVLHYTPFPSNRHPTHPRSNKMTLRMFWSRISVKFFLQLLTLILAFSWMHRSQYRSL